MLSFYVTILLSSKRVSPLGHSLSAKELHTLPTFPLECLCKDVQDYFFSECGSSVGCNFKV